MLSNSFVSHVDLDSVMERIDLEMAVNLGTVADVNAPSNHFLNLNCQYNFKPVNFDFLVLSRLAFAQKKKRIQKLVSKRITEKRQQLAGAYALMLEKERVGIRKQQ